MSYQINDPHADHPGYEARECPLSLKVTQRSPWGPVTRAGFSCLMTGGHCVPDEHCDARRKREAEYQERRAQIDADRGLPPVVPFHRNEMPVLKKKVTEAQAVAQGELLDAVKIKHYARNDAHLGRILGESVVVLSRLRHGTAIFGAALAIRILDKETMSLNEIRALLPEDHPFNAKKGKKK